MPKPSPLLIIMLLLIAAFIGLRNEQRIFEARGTFSIKQTPGAVILVWTDPVEAPMADRLAAAFREWQSKTDKFVIDLNSPGGAVTEGGLVIDEINAMKRTHKVETLVRAGRQCLSMCVPIFLAGDERRAALSSRWMFHEPVAVDSITDEEVQEPDWKRRRSGRKFIEEHFVSSPMDTAWREKLSKEWVDREVWKSGNDLYAENSGIITRLE